MIPMCDLIFQAVLDNLFLADHLFFLNNITVVKYERSIPIHRSLRKHFSVL